MFEREVETGQVRESVWTTAYCKEVNVWVTVAAVYDQSQGLVSTFIDGKKIAEIKLRKMFDVATDGPMVLGSMDGENAFFDGFIGCVRVFKAALNEEEIEGILNCDFGK